MFDYGLELASANSVVLRTWFRFSFLAFLELAPQAKSQFELQ
jgi:hypothetical protein